ncbi:MAG: hypothetical protein H8D23_01665 [Candidatus Brocadiales bacterium]|nr:hypothetical protein [Candidatus Brocadiales bacterium]
MPILNTSLTRVVLICCDTKTGDKEVDYFSLNDDISGYFHEMLITEDGCAAEFLGTKLATPAS